ncbi:MAG: glycosyltransferase [Rhodoglobus sp.]
MVSGIRSVAMISLHTSPTSPAGTGDAGGLNVSVLGVAAELAVRGVEVDLLTRAVGRPDVTRLLPGVTLHELAAGGPGALPKNLLTEVTDEFGEAVARLTRREARGYDLLHAHYWLSGIAVLPVAIELNLPLVQSFHTTGAMKNAVAGPATSPEPESRIRSEMFIASQADAVIAASAAEATALIELTKAPADRTWIVPPGVDLELFFPRPAATHEAIRHALGLEADRPLMVIAGRLQPLKGHELAVRALAAMTAMRGRVPILVVAGEATPGDEGFARGLRRLASELGVGDQVRFVGALHRDAMAGLLSAATVTIVTSFSETFGLIALESAAAGTPVIAYRAGGLVSSVQEGVSGVLLGTRDPRQWAQTITGLIEDPPRCTALGLTARAHAERFSWAASAEQLLALYDEAVALR